jgi:hypothetical protein
MIGTKEVAAKLKNRAALFAHDAAKDQRQSAR